MIKNTNNIYISDNKLLQNKIRNFLKMHFVHFFTKSLIYPNFIHLINNMKLYLRLMDKYLSHWMSRARNKFELLIVIRLPFISAVNFFLEIKATVLKQA